MTLTRQFFGTDGIRGRVGVHPITTDFALKLGLTIGHILSQDGKGTVLIGTDTRVSGYMLTAALEAGLLASLDVYRLGVMPTPAIAYLTRSLGAQMGIVVSASHNPYYDNGIKFFNADGKKLPDAIELQIEQLLQTQNFTFSPKKMGKMEYLQEAQVRYIEFCKQAFNKNDDLKGMKIVVDCGNGATYQIAPQVLQELGANVIAINCQPDGFNINEKCGSTYIEPLQKAVLEHRAELGIAFDGDGDRVIFVDDKGEMVDGDELLYIVARFYQHTHKLKGGVVGTQMSNLGLEKAFGQMKVPFLRSKVGDRYVMDCLMHNNWSLGGEGSGHIICLDKTTTGDGIISALSVLEALCYFDTSLHVIKKGMHKNIQVLLNVPAQESDKIIQSPRLKQALQHAEKQMKDQGRILLRPSGTEPLIRIMVEGEDKGFIMQIANEIADAVKSETRV